MSLLLEALKKAEKAKEEAQRRAKGGEAPAATPFDVEATVADTGKRVLTRDELPDISQPLEILSEDLQPPPPPRGAPLAMELEPAAPESALAPPAEARTAPRAAASPAAERNETRAAERAAAQKVFEAKFKEPNPRLPFFIAMGVLGAFAVGTAGYFWYQLRPPPALVNPNPPRTSGEAPVVAVDSKAPAAAVAGAPVTPTESEVPGLPGAPAGAAAPPAKPAATGAEAKPAPSAEAAKPAAAAPAPAPAAQPAKPAPAPAAARARDASAAVERSVSVRRAAPQIHPRVEAGFAAFQAGDLAVARAAYEQVLREESGNRDALLGLAAVELRAHRFDVAESLYQKLLRADPRDAHAHAGMLALRAQQIDPLVAESRVKTLLAADPEQGVLHFTLGNQYAQQGRWAEAQQAYFRAHAAEPGNPDFAFNLAVSLDQLRQPKLALEYYRRALALAEKRAPSFDPQAARTRVQDLSR